MHININQHTDDVLASLYRRIRHRGGQIGLVSAATTRPGIAPDLPTMAEAGLPGFDTSLWFGLVAPPGTPREVIDKLIRRTDQTSLSPTLLSSKAKPTAPATETGRVSWPSSVG